MPIRILVVDDATFIRDMMKKHLRERIAGAEIYDATDGNRAIAVLKANNIDLILSDWEMPGMSGAEFLAWVRGQDAYKTIPFVMVSSRGDRDHVVKAVQAGVSDYLTKPFTPEELIKKAAKQLQKIGIDPNIKFGKAAAKNQRHAFGSIDALTGGSADKAAAPAAATSGDKTVAAEQKPQTASTTKTTAGKKTGQPKVQLRFADATYPCELKDLSLQTLSGTVERGEQVPAVFDQVVVDIATEEGDDIARINGYVHSVQAGENRINTKIVKITVRYVDDDPQKLEVLSRFIGKRKT